MARIGHAQPGHTSPSFALIVAFFVVAPVWVARVHASDAPLIQHVEPSSGPAGTLIRISGLRFHEGAKAFVGDTLLAIDQRLPNLITARLPAGAKSGWVTVETAAGKVVGPEFVVTPTPAAPVIESVEPNTAAPGTEVTIHGQHFSTRMAEDSVRFGDKPAIVIAASPVGLRVLVPDDARTAAVSVRVALAGEATSSTQFEVSTATAITELSPRAVAPGGTLVIKGTGFSKDAKKDRVYLNNQEAHVQAATETSLTVSVPRAVASGRVLVDVKGAGRAYSKQELEIQRAPSIVGFAPQSAASGTRVTVRGGSFGDDPSAVEARVGELPAQVVSAAHTQLVLIVPPLAKSGRLSIRVHGVGPAWSEQDLVVLAPLSITGFSPRSGPVGSTVLIEGTGFSTSPARDRVRFAGELAEVTAATSTRLSVRVPVAGSGLVTLQVEGSGSAEGLSPFVVTQPPRITAVSATTAPAGSALTIRGSGFGASPALVTVTLGTQKLVVQSVREDAVVVTLPTIAMVGKLSVAVAQQGSAHFDRDLSVTAP
ncbi:MAG TPA: IPT/TIG domain-containing protein [Polyangiales bacterium]